MFTESIQRHFLISIFINILESDVFFNNFYIII
jgi:hypothetical protein